MSPIFYQLNYFAFFLKFFNFKKYKFLIYVYKQISALTGLEPAIFWLTVKCFDQLSYNVINKWLIGIEPILYIPQTNTLPLSYNHVHFTGFEPMFLHWKGNVLTY